MRSNLSQKLTVYVVHPNEGEKELLFGNVGGRKDWRLAHFGQTSRLTDNGVLYYTYRIAWDFGHYPHARFLMSYGGPYPDWDYQGGHVILTKNAYEIVDPTDQDLIADFALVYEEMLKCLPDSNPFIQVKPVFGKTYGTRIPLFHWKRNA